MTFLSSMSGFLFSVLAFVIILVPLVVFHEFGHFIFARIFGVKAETFSVGFGPKIFSKQFGETEFRFSAIPLGGYVKLLGEDRDAPIPEKDQARSLQRQKPWKRFLIFLGGPLFNFILAIFIFMAMLVIGEPQVASVAGRVIHGSAAEKAGFRSGDRILEMDGKPVTKYEEIVLGLNENPGKTMHFLVRHVGSTQNVAIEAPVTSRVGFSIYGEAKDVGEIEGLSSMARSNQAGVSDPNSLAGKAGIKTGDKINRFALLNPTDWEQIEREYAVLRPGTKFEIEYQRAQEKAPRVSEFFKPVVSKDLAKDFGLHSSELFVEKTVPKSPAEAVGVRAGDRLVSIGKTEVRSFFELKDAVQKAGETNGKVLLEVERDGKRVTWEIDPTATTGRDPVLRKTTQYTVGVMPMLVFAEPVTTIERVLNPFTLVYKATDRMITLSWRNLVSVRKMVTGDVSVGSIGGPLMIGKIAGESLSRGLFSFLTMMAIFSIGLGVLNILPVPVLDGGHLMLLSLEIVRGKPLTPRQMEIAQGVGLVLILALMGIAFHNDISRLIYSS